MWEMQPGNSNGFGTRNGIRNRWRSAKRCAAFPERPLVTNDRARAREFVPNGNGGYGIWSLRVDGYAELRVA
jgi:hypothetical protein